jgi:hypothetical protein
MNDISLSGLAGLFLYEALTEPRAPGARAFRLRSGPNGYWLDSDVPRPEDCFADFKGRVVLVVERSLCETMGRSRLDAALSDDEVTLILERAAAPGSEGTREVVWRCVLS